MPPLYCPVCNKPFAASPSSSSLSPTHGSHSAFSAAITCCFKPECARCDDAGVVVVHVAGRDNAGVDAEVLVEGCPGCRPDSEKNSELFLRALHRLRLYPRFMEVALEVVAAHSADDANALADSMRKLRRTLTVTGAKRGV